MSKKLNYTLNLDAEIGELVSKIEKVKGSMANLTASGKAPGIEKSFASIEKAVEKMKEKVATPIESAAVFGNLKKDVASIEVQLDNLTKAVQDFLSLTNAQKIELLPPELLGQIKQIESALSTFGDTFEQAAKKTEALTTAEKNLTNAQAELEKIQRKVAISNQLIGDDNGRIQQTKQEVAAIEEQIKVLEKFKATQKVYEEAKKAGKSAPKNKAYTDEGGTTHNFTKDKNAAKKVGQEINIDIDTQGTDAALEKLNEKLKEQQGILKKSQSQLTSHENTLKKQTAELTVAEQGVDKLSKEYEDLNKAFESTKISKTNEAFAKLRTAADKLGIDLKDIPLEYTEEGFKELTARMQQTVSDGIDTFNTGLNTTSNNLQDTADALSKTADQVSNASVEFDEANERFKENSAILEKARAFVGLSGGIALARKAMQSAISTIKELDAAMTEMAVVTDLEVGDYWNQLPEHTKRANALGISIKSVYEAETLYYQQGLKTAEVTAMTNETLKMARIANLSAEEATNKMTAALRGFNMELNETSASRVADVYSELAAITASDVDEISTAMTKTASIAASAGMEFETTAAFLSQIIETTRESAETAGTAMKTVIARFSEVKELKEQGLDSGEDSEGEIIDVNKIQTALRSVGISMDEFFKGTEGLDSIFMKLAEKWDTLDVTTQRYIATTAAGSRQQSRFIAMMSDYSRTSELVAAANNSAGASNEQFEKTLDSLASKLSQLKNAWDTFTMSLTNNEILKVGIGLLTSLMNTINEIIAFFDKFGMGSAASIGLIITALYLGDKAINVFSKSLKEGNTIFQSFGIVGKTALSHVSNSFKQATINAAKLNQTLKKGFTQDRAAALNKYNKYLKQEQSLDDSRYKNKQKLNSLEQSGKKNTEEYMNLQSKYSKQQELSEGATKRRIVAQEELFATMGLSSAQEKEAIALQATGIGMDQASILASSGYTAAQIAEMAAARGVTEAEMAEILVKEASIKKTGLAAVANFILASAQTLQQQGLKGLITSWWAEIKAKMASIAATWGQTAANYGLQTSMWAILAVVALIVAAIIVVVGLIALIVQGMKDLKKNSPEGKLDAAKKATDAAASAAENAAESYKKLSSSFDSLSDKYKNLETLTEGTEEWKEAVELTNEEVLELIDKFPELAQFVSAKSSVLTLNLESKEVQDVLTAEAKRAKRTLALQRSSEIYEAEVALKNQTIAMRDKAHYDKPGGQYSSGSDSLDDDQIQDLAYALAKGELIDEINTKGEKQAIQDWINENGGTFYLEGVAGVVAENIKDLKAFGKEVDKTRQKQEVLRESIGIAAAAMVDTAGLSNEEEQQVRNAANGGKLQTVIEESEKEWQRAYLNKENDTLQKRKEEVAKAQYGNSATVSGNTISYFDENGKEESVELTDEAFKSQWAALQATNQMADALATVPARIKKVTTAFEKLEVGLGSAYKQLVTNPEKMTKQKATTLKSEKLTDDALETIYYDLTNAERQYYGGFENFKNSITEANNKILEIFANAEEKIGTITGSTVTLLGAFDTESATIYKNFMEVASAAVGNTKQRAKILSDLTLKMNGLANKLPAEEFNAFMSVLDTIDVSNLNDWDKLKATLQETGYGALVASKEFKDFSKAAQDAANATNKINLTKFVSVFKTVQEFIGQIYQGEQNRYVDSEIYKQLIDSNASLAKEFVYTEKGYMYIGSSMLDLANALMIFSEVQRQDNLNRITEIMYIKDVAKKVGEAEARFSLEQTDALTKSGDQKDFIATIVDSVKQSKGDIGALNIAGLTNNTDIAALNSLSDEKVEEIFKSLVDALEHNWDYDFSEQNAMATSTYRNFSIDQNAAMLSSEHSATTFEGSTTDWINELLGRGEILLTQAIEKGVEGSSIDDFRAYLTNIETIQNSDKTDTEKKEAIKALDVSGEKGAVAKLMAAVAVAQEASEEIEKWVTEFSYLDQLTRQINSTQRASEKIEREYNKLLQDNTLSQEEILEITKLQVQELNKQANLYIQQWAESAAALTAMTDKAGTNKDFAQYVDYNATTGEILIDYEGAETAYGADEERGALFEEYVASLYELQSTAEDAQDNLEDIEDKVKDLQDRGKDDYSNLWNSIREVLIKNQQRSIDEMSKVNDSIQEAENSLLDSIQKQIENERQLAEKEKSAQSITDKETQLAYMLRDTSGMYSLDALDLSTEIEQEKKDYTDLLVDQAITAIEEGNEQAAHQRQLQINIAQAQLDAYAASQKSWQDAQTVLNYALSSEGALGIELTNLGINLGMLLGSDGCVATNLVQLLTNGQELNSIETQNQMNDINAQMENATAYALINSQLLTNGIQANTNAATSDLLLSSGLANVSAGVTSEFNLWKIKASELTNQSNATIGTARTNIVSKIVESIGAATTNAGSITSAIGGLLDGETEENYLTTLTSTETQASFADWFVQKANEDPALFKDYQTDLDTIAGKEAEAVAATQNQNYQNLLADSHKLTSDEYKKLLEGKVVSKDYETYSAEYDQNSEARAARTKAESDATAEATRQAVASIVDGGTTTEEKQDERSHAILAQNASKGGSWNDTDLVSNSEEAGWVNVSGVGYYVKTSGNADKTIGQYATEDGIVPGQLFKYEGSIYMQASAGVARKLQKSNDMWNGGTNGGYSSMVAALRFKTGGLADYTGPAWLDGTKSNPELVLNAQDTKNFIQLKDILADVMNNNTQNNYSENNSTQKVYDIDINVESLNSDYDVEQLADKIRDMLYEDSIYRNVNDINLTR